MARYYGAQLAKRTRGRCIELRRWRECLHCSAGQTFESSCVQKGPREERNLHLLCCPGPHGALEAWCRTAVSQRTERRHGAG